MNWDPEDCPGCKLASAITTQLSHRNGPVKAGALEARLEIGQTGTQPDWQRTYDREGLALIICRLDELRQMAASHRLDPLAYLLDVAHAKANEMNRHEHKHHHDRS
jgi:hypothetical protein